MPQLWVIIAAYDELQNVKKLMPRLAYSLHELPAKCRQLWIVEGRDGTREWLETYTLENDAAVQVLYQDQPQGLGYAFRKGFKTAIQNGAEIVVTMDADLNHQPEEIRRLFDVLQSQNADIVVGSRKAAGGRVENVPLWKAKLSDWGNAAVRHLTRSQVRDLSAGFKVYRVAILRQLKITERGFAFQPETLLHASQLGAKIVEVPILFTYRSSGESKMALGATAFGYLRLLWRLTRQQF